MNLPKGFVAEQIYEVPNAEQGSWISMAVDDRGRLITSDQKGGLYRLTVSEDQQVAVEAIDLSIGMAMGLLYFNDTLYVMVNGQSADGPGLYAVNDTDGDDQYDAVRLLRGIVPPGKPGAGHGNHAIVPAPDGQSLYLICGNMAGMPVDGFDDSRVPQNWDEDQLLPGLPDSHGHAAGTMAPGGWVARTDLNGEHWELVCSGFRNIYDAAFNQRGDLFTFDADMEFDIGTPWYRPPRICHVVSGGEFGWRNGSGKWPAYSPDSLPPVADIGPGSPTGVTFGYQTNFPEPYRSMMFLCDWSYGRIYMASVSRRGASYMAKHSLFAGRAPLPVVDIVANPHDGALYLVTGGRNVQSHVYRIRYTGEEISVETGVTDTTQTLPERAALENGLHQLRRTLEGLHHQSGSRVVDEVWPHLGHSDRHIRFAARIALEHQAVDLWKPRVFQETDSQTLVTAAIAASRNFPESSADSHELITSLLRLNFQSLSHNLQLEFLRAVSLTLIRQGEPGEADCQSLRQFLLAEYPSGDSTINRELCRLLMFLNTSDAIAPTVKLMEAAELPEDQIHYAMTLRNIQDGWSVAQRRRYFEWLLKGRLYVGGRSNGEFVEQICKDAEASLSSEHKAALADVLAQLATRPAPSQAMGFGPVIQKWTVGDLIDSRDTAWSVFLKNADDASRGDSLFAAAACIRCHRVKGRGGVVGPDLSSISRRFSPHDLLEAIVDPAKSVPVDYQSVSVVTQNGNVVTGQIVNLGANGISLRTDALAPANLTRVPHDEIEEIVPSKTSLMPSGLLDSLRREEVHALLSWLAGQSAGAQ